MSTATIPCTVFKGFFESEFYIMVGSSSAIVDRDDILRLTSEPKVEAAGHGYVQVVVLQDKDDQSLVELPGQPVVGGLRTWVPSSELKQEAA